MVHGDTWVKIPVGGFMQVNHAVNQALVAQVIESVCLVQPATFLDLYSGAGNYALPLASQGIQGHAVEVDSAAIIAAREAAHAQNIHSVRFESGDAQEIAERLVRDGETFDVVVANPPRAGLKSTAHAVAQLARSGIALCSCDAKAFARDLEVLTANNWSLQSVTIFDMFPHTRHVECFAWLRPKASPV